MPERAPSPSRRLGFGHDPERGVEFRRRYRAERRAQAAQIRRLREALLRASARTGAGQTLRRRSAKVRPIGG